MWKQRNQRIFEGKQASSLQVFSFNKEEII
ncbi:hypothetical protein BAE44_0019434 [Dichanthelium oligosanthes]|uniref:Uncharacterized protein n=1 Tax=Dichanthelium oligosanthes TaxID=888268 RepID=A0A1E5V3A9_9POAL|nr:hypothetical protein BAE44_0019434 [Dichanthelium oligosanthes]